MQKPFVVMLLLTIVFCLLFPITAHTGEMVPPGGAYLGRTLDAGGDAEGNFV